MANAIREDKSRALTAAEAAKRKDEAAEAEPFACFGCPFSTGIRLCKYNLMF